MSHDRVWAAGGGIDVTLWRASDGEPIRRLPARETRGLCFSRDDSALATANATHLEVWSVLDGRRLLREAWSVKALAPDGERGFLAVVVEAGRIGVRRVPSGEDLFVVDGKTDVAALSADGKRLAVAPTHGRGAIVVYDLSGAPAVRLQGPGEHRYLTEVWTPWGEREVVPRVTDAFLRALAFDPNGGRLASGGNETVVRVWDVATGVRMHEVDLKDVDVGALDWHESGDRVAIAHDPLNGRAGPVRVWAPDTGDAEEIGPGRVVAFRGDDVLRGGRSPSVVALAASADGAVVIAHGSATIEARSAVTGDLLWGVPVSDQADGAIGLGRDGTGWARISEPQELDFGLRRFRVDSGLTDERLAPAPTLTWSLDVSPEGLVAVAGHREQVDVWDPVRRVVVARLACARAHAVRFVAGGVWVTRQDGALLFFEVREAAEPLIASRVLVPPGYDPAQDRQAHALAISGDGARAVSGFGDVIRVWDLAEGRVVQASEATHPLDRVLAVGIDVEGAPWGLVGRRSDDPERGEGNEVCWWSPWRGFVPVAWSPDTSWRFGAKVAALPGGSFVLSGDDGVLRVYRP